MGRTELNWNPKLGFHVRYIMLKINLQFNSEITTCLLSDV